MRSISERTVALAVLCLTLLVQAATLWPEISITRIDLNDNIFHLGLIERIVHSIESGSNPLDSWSPEWGFGFPVLRSYQLFAHLLVAGVYFALGKTVSLMTVFVWARFLSVALIPLSFFACARWLLLPWLTAAAAAALSPLISTNFLFGIDYGSFTWSGIGLFSQAVATHFLLLAVGLGFTAMRDGRRVMTAGILAGLACISHLVYGYMAALTLVMAALIPDPVGRAVRLRRTIAIGAAAFAVAAFQLAPLFADSGLINHSRWEPVWKWDGYGASWTLSQLFTGQLLDYGRLPVLTALAFGGAAWLWIHRRGREVGQGMFLSCGSLLWILLLFGRPFWGSLLNALGISEDMHLHRVIAGAQVFLILLAAVALAEIWRLTAARWWTVAAVAITVVLFYPMVRERAQMLADDERFGTANLQAHASVRPQVETVLAEVQRQGGRAYAGLAAGWGGQFKVGNVPLYGIFSTAGIPEAGFLYHSMSMPGDFLPVFDERTPEQYRLLAIRSVVAPPEWTPPPFLTRRATVGRFNVYEAPGQGYFDLVEAPATVRTTRRNFYDLNDRWLHSDWVGKRMHLLLDWRGNAPMGVTRIASDAPLPAVASAVAGGCVDRAVEANHYGAECDAARPAYALFKMTWHPNWRAYVDGASQPTVMLSPGFTGVPVAAGRHTVEFRYEPGPLKPILAILGCVTLLGVGLGRRFAPSAALNGVIDRAGRAASAHSKALLTAAGLIGLAAPVFLPLLTGALISGSQSFSNFPRVIETHQNFLNGIVLPRWAPDLGHGFGQPLFIFHPPLFPWIAELLHLAGLNFVAAANVEAAAFVCLAAFSMFLLGRHYFGDPGGWIAAAAYLYAPYFAADLYARSAVEELAALAILPLAIWGFASFARTGIRRHLVAGILAYTALWFCDFQTSMIATPLLIGLIAVNAWIARSWRMLGSQLAALGLAIALGAASWLPAFAEAKYVSMHMWRSNDGMSFSAGWSHLLVAALAWAVIASLRPRIADLRLVSFFGAGVAVLGWLTLGNAVGPAAFCLAMLTASAARPILILPKSRQTLALAGAVALLIVPNLPHLRAEKLTEVDLSLWAPQKLAASGLETTTAGEVTPRWMPLQPPVYAARPTVVSGNAQLRESQQTPFSWTGEVEATSVASVRLPRAWFPGWTVRLDGSPIDAGPSSDTGLLQFDVPAGHHVIDAAFGRSPARRLGESISAAALAMLAFAAFRRGRVVRPVERRAAAASA